ncbi:hypothetical protein VOLCADRAFT_104311 [Volvox carteri f. nagariensis]|uniref:Protein kinase domain-containing protein n=1 Tax=Volvox carteri f. nagariensis TaxID=3068 RepID=D8TSS3_VOLCA|nr:uncharacterized protein VOLCADRAFT_104311 [Volvox carteri f. nagariensis]EFJ49423.1 hypothetical protein VOLCADRAFT_104311 [Volvox carteri f. nagariensis]|eukprot:XP_002949404.1 hypothetical protein VOLCADRAFT_104311 [Volvox carteri f. nagariensis]
MELDVRRTFVDLEHDSTIAWDRLTDFQYVSKGGFALVFVANLRRSDGVAQPVAVKVLKPENHFRPAIYSKFLQEVALQTALPHSLIVRALGFCSVPVGPLIAAAPPGILTPDSSGGGGGGARDRNSKKAALSAAQEWFAKRRLLKCWALVMELMPKGPAVGETAVAGTGGVAGMSWPASGAGSGPGSYGDVQGLLWLIDVADAMTFLHSQQPLLIHRDLKLENILLQRDADGRVRAKLSDFGLTVVGRGVCGVPAVDAAGSKVPPPQVLCAPGQTLEDVRNAVPGGGGGAVTALSERPCSSSAQVAATDTVNAAPEPPGGTPSRSAPASSRQLNLGHPSPSPYPLRNPQGQGDPHPHQQQRYEEQQYQQCGQQEKKQQLIAGRKVVSSSQVLVQAKAARGLGHVQTQAQAQGQAQAQSTLTAASAVVTAAGAPWLGGAAAVGPNQGSGGMFAGKVGGGGTATATAAAARRPWSAAQAQLRPQLPLPMQLPSHEENAVGVPEWGSSPHQHEEGEKAGKKPPPPLPPSSISASQPPVQAEGPPAAVMVAADAGRVLLRPQRSSVSWSGPQRQIGDDVLGHGHHQGRRYAAGPGPSGLGLARQGPGAHRFRSAVAQQQQGQQQQGRALSQAPGPPPLPPITMTSSSRLSETGHLQVKMEQLNGLLRMGMGHRDYLPDMYQMTFKLTSQCGSVCYMAPEVARQLPYNQKADVFSFGCLVYEVMSRQLLSDGIPPGDVEAALEYLGRVAWSGWRPDLPARLPKELRLLISLCWHREPRLRPSFPTIAARLREVLRATATGPLHSKITLNAVTVQPPPPPLAAQRSQLLLELQVREQQRKSKEQQQQQQQQQQWAMLQQHHQQQQQLLLLQQQMGQYRLDQSTNQKNTVRMLGGSVSTGNMWNAFQHTTVPGGGGAAALSPASSAASTTQQFQLQAHRQQLQLQLQQLNACTRAGGSTPTLPTTITPPTTTATTGGILPVPYSVNSVSVSRQPLHVESTGTIMAHTTTATTITGAGCRMSSPVLGAVTGGRGGGAGTLEPVVVHPAGRATTSTLTMTTATGPQNSDSSYYSALPSPVSPTSSRVGNRRSSGCPGLGPSPGLLPGQSHDRASRASTRMA